MLSNDVQSRIIRKKVVLYHPSQALITPLALLATSRLLVTNGYESLIVTGHEINREKRIIGELKDALCFGITSMVGPQIKDGLEMAALVKRTYPDIPIVWGGWHPSTIPHQTIEHPLVDIVIRGQGERTLFELVEALYQKKPLDNVLGLIFKNSNGSIITTEPRETEPLDNLPPVPYELIDIEKFLISSSRVTRSVFYYTSYGCPFRCGFCVNSVVYKRKWNALSSEHVVKEIKNLVHKYDINSLLLADSNFFLNEDRVAEICKGIVNEGINVNLHHLTGRAEQLNKYREETFELMNKAGIKNIFVGAESPNQDMLDYITKDARADDCVNLTKRCKKYGIVIDFNFVLGFPARNQEEKMNYEKCLKKEFNDMLNFIDKLIKIDRKHRFNITLYTPLHNAPLYNKSIENGFIPPKSLDEWSMINLDDITVPWIPKKYSKLIKLLNNHYFRFISGWEPMKPSLLDKIIRSITEIEWNHRFFRVPMGYYLRALIIKMRSIKRGLGKKLDLD